MCFNTIGHCIRDKNLSKHSNEPNAPRKAVVDKYQTNNHTTNNRTSEHLKCTIKRSRTKMMKGQ